MAEIPDDGPGDEMAGGGEPVMTPADDVLTTTREPRTVSLKTVVVVGAALTLALVIGVAAFALGRSESKTATTSATAAQDDDGFAPDQVSSSDRTRASATNTTRKSTTTTTTIVTAAAEEPVATTSPPPPPTSSPAPPPPPPPPPPPTAPPTITSSGQFDSVVIWSPEMKRHESPNTDCSGWGAESYQIQARDGAGTVMALATFSGGQYSRQDDPSGFTTTTCKFTYTVTVQEVPVYTIVALDRSGSDVKDSATVSNDELRRGAPALYALLELCPEC